MSEHGEQRDSLKSADKSYVVNVVEPANAAGNDLALFEKLVLEGGEVNPHTLPGLMANAQSLAFARKGDSIVGVGGNKRPSRSHKAKVFRKANAQLDAEQFEFELGWVYVRPEERRQGIAPALVESLMLAVGTALVYATSAVDKGSMHTALGRVGFRRIGVPFSSEQNESDIQLFVRTRMDTEISSRAPS